MQSIHDEVRRAETNFLQGTTKLGKYVSWSMHDTIETVDAYLNSTHTSGPTDSLGREKPFFNIVSAATNIWYRATDIDRKNIKFIPQDSDSVILAFVANVLLQQWMDKNRFGVFLNQWGRALARYGSAVLKFVEKNGELTATVVPWNRFIADSVDFNAIPHIEKFYKTAAQLKNMATPGHPDYAGYDMEVVNSLLSAIANRKTLDKQTQDNQPSFIELYEVHGLLDSRLLDDEPDESIEDDKINYVQQMHVISYVRSEGDEEYEDFCLYKGKERRDPYMLTHLIEEDGRTLSIGAVEYLFEAQWMVNHSTKNMKDTLDLASRLIFQTADGSFVGRNVLSAIETGDILIHQPNMGLERIANDKPDIAATQNFSTMWQTLAQELTATPDSMRGVTPTSGTPYSTTALLAGQANSLFEIMTENKGLAIEDMCRDFLIPNLKRKLKNKDEVVAILDGAGVKEIDAMYIPQEAIKRFNKSVVSSVLNGQVPQPFNPQQAEGAVQQSMASLGNKRFFKPDELDKQTWADLFSDFEWDCIKVEVTNENVDKQAVLTTLSTVLQTVASNPMILQDPNAKMLFSKILTETGIVSPLEVSATSPAPSAAPPAGVTVPSTALPAQPSAPSSSAAPLIGG